jgi:molecular chaperone GrpE
MEDQKKEPTPENTPPSKNHHPGNKDAAQPSNEAMPPEGDGQSQAAKSEGQAEEAPEASEVPEAPMVALTMEEYDALQAELEKMRASSNDYFDGWQRERADFSNYKKRVERDAGSAQQNALAAVVKKYLVILDDLERALKTRPTNGEGAAWADGIELICRKLSNMLEQEGVRRMEAEKESFDPRRHEAIMQEESPDHESGQIIEVIQQGYLLGDRVIRPALVRVAR